MSKCELNLTFDRPDRTYWPGETVRGEVDVLANTQVRCNGLVVEHFWKTHGKGNATHGAVQSQNVFQGELQAGQSHQVPFSFVTPNGPPTYHGRYLYVDHYVRARVDIPWALDPKVEEEYILAPGGSDYSQLPVLQGERESQAGGLLRMLGSGCGAAFLVVAFLAPIPVGFLLFPVGILVLFLSLRRWLAEWRIGKVELAAPVRIASPGDELTIELALTPRKAASVRSAKVKLMCVEEVVSGSGTKQTTHTSTVLEQIEDLGIGENDVQADATLRVQKTIMIPPTDAFSFRAPDNRINWMLQVQIDIPNWPDWHETIPLVIKPRSAESAYDVQTTLSRERPPLPGPADPQAPVAVGPAITVEGLTLLGPAELSYVLDRVLEEPRWSGQRGEKIEHLLGHAFELRLDVEYAEPTHGAAFDGRYRDGRTIYGALRGTSHKLAVQLLPDHNPQADQNGPFALDLIAAPLSWNEPEERLLLREARDAE